MDKRKVRNLRTMGVQLPFSTKGGLITLFVYTIKLLKQNATLLMREIKD